MDEIVVSKWCDPCYQQEGKRTPVVAAFVVAIAEDRRDSVPRQVVACEAHASEIRALASMVKLSGEKVDAQIDHRAACPVCEVKMHPASLGPHLVAKHGAKKLVQPSKCPDCGHRSETAVGMTTHRRNQHGYNYVDEMAKTIDRRRKGAKAT